MVIKLCNPQRNSVRSAIAIVSKHHSVSNFEKTDRNTEKSKAQCGLKVFEVCLFHFLAVGTSSETGRTKCTIVQCSFKNRRDGLRNTNALLFYTKMFRIIHK